MSVEKNFVCGEKDCKGCKFSTTFTAAMLTYFGPVYAQCPNRPGRPLVLGRVVPAITQVGEQVEQVDVA